MTGRRAAVVVVAAAMAAAGLAAPAAAGTFTVDQCNAAVGLPRSAGVQADLWSTVGGRMLSTCGGDVPGSLSFYTPNYRLAVNATTETTFTLPDSMPHAALRAVWLNWRSMPQAPSPGPAFFHVHAGGAGLLAVPSGAGTPAGSAQRFAVPAGARALGLSTWCSPANGPGWCNWPGPLLQLRAVTAEVEESVEPFASASGALLAAGPHAGVEPVTVVAGDEDSGVRSLALTLGGVPVAAAAASCSTDRLPPCAHRLTRTLDADTRAVSDGTRRLRLTAVDAAGNEVVEDLGAVHVVNHPVVARRPPATPPRPPVAGPAPGPVHVPNGRPVSPRAKVRAWFEWRGRRRLSLTVRPGVRVRIRGRVTDPYGRGIAGAALGLRETMHGWQRAATGVRTRPDGRFTAFTYIGPSRTLRFVYYPYSDSPRPRRGPLLRLRVRRPPHHRGPRTVTPGTFGGAS